MSAKIKTDVRHMGYRLLIGNPALKGKKALEGNQKLPRFIDAGSLFDSRDQAHEYQRRFYKNSDYRIQGVRARFTPDYQPTERKA